MCFIRQNRVVIKYPDFLYADLCFGVIMRGEIRIVANEPVHGTEPEGAVFIAPDPVRVGF